MSTRSLLVCYPGYPFGWGALTPSAGAASVAGALNAFGHRCSIRDYGTLETVTRLTPREGPELVRWFTELAAANGSPGPLSSLPFYVQATRANRAFRRLQRIHCIEVAQAVSSAYGNDFAVFQIDTIDDAYCAALISSVVRATRPELPLVGAGRFFETFGVLSFDVLPHLDCVCGTDAEMTIAAFAESVRAPSTWKQIPGLLVRHERPVACSRTRWEGHLGSLPQPAYDTDTYPDIRAHQKLMIFEVEDSRPELRVQDATPNSVTAPLFQRPRLRPVEEVCNQIWSLRAQYGARLFRFTSSGTPGAHARSIANALCQRGIGIAYSRTQKASSAEAAASALLRASGCYVLDIQVPTGSQRLLDDYYCTGANVSDTEAVLRSSKRAGMETVLELTYPCPHDDYHTRDESVRLIRRTAPHAVSIELPALVPSCHWFSESSRYGFDISPSSYARHAMNCLAMYPLPESRWRKMPYAMQGRGLGQAQQEQEQLRAELAELGVGSFAGEIESLVQAVSNVPGKGRASIASRWTGVLTTPDSFAVMLSRFNESATALSSTPSTPFTADLPRVVGD